MLMGSLAGVFFFDGHDASEFGARRLERSATGLSIAFDGRLDNREDLLVRFGQTSSEATDAALALAAFEQDGVDGLRGLIGDWSLVIWDAPRRLVYFARDFMGVRPLYYCLDSTAVRWSSSLADLTTRAGRVDDLEESFVARFMALRFSTEATPYRGIRAVPTATCVRFSSNGNETRERFWSIQPSIIRYADNRDYANHLRALWCDAIASRLQRPEPVWAELSGGLDSSSIVCTADALIRNARVAATTVNPFSHVTTKSPEGDERRFIAEVEQWIGRRSAILAVEDHQDLRVDEWEWVTPLAPRGVQIAAERLVRDAGGRIVLSGRMGDVVMGCLPDNSVEVFDEIVAGRWFTALKRIRDWSRATRKPFIEITRALAAEAARPWVRNSGYALSDPQRAGWHLLSDRLRSLIEVEPLPNDGDALRLSKRELARLVMGYSRQARLQLPLETPGIVYTYPFAHRPLVEFVLSIPGEQLSAPGQLRSLMRRALRGMVPSRVLARTSKGHYAPAVMRAVRPMAAALAPVDKLLVVQRGWIDAARLDTAIHALAAGAGPPGSEVERVLRLEQWLISRERRARAAIPKRKEVNADGVLIA
jgi:asparagine synthase (glutamine-hydrolysing)